MRHAVSDAMASRQGTGSLSWSWELGADLGVAAAALLIPFVPAVVIGLSRASGRRVALVVLVGTVTATMLLGYAWTAGTSRADLVSPERLRDAWEAYVVADRAGRGSPPLSADALREQEIPEGLVAELSPASSPASIDRLPVLLVLVTVGSLMGYASGGAARPRPR